MTEVLSEQNEQRDGRPIGRFLLGFDDYNGHHDSLTYATNFVNIPGNFQKYKHKTVVVKEANNDLRIDGRDVVLAFSIARSALIWTVTVAAERHRIDDLSTGHIPHGGERYELHCAKPKSFGTYREYDMQRRAMRQQEFDSPVLLNRLQGVVETLLGSNLHSENE